MQNEQNTQGRLYKKEELKSSFGTSHIKALKPGRHKKQKQPGGIAGLFLLGGKES